MSTEPTNTGEDAHADEASVADAGERLRMALAEAGYPFADVWGADEDGPWWCENVPADVWDRACEVVNR